MAHPRKHLTLAAIILLCASVARAAEPTKLPEGWTRFDGAKAGGAATISAGANAPGGAPVVHLSVPEGAAEGVCLRVATLSVDKPGESVSAEIVARASHAGQALTLIIYSDPRDGKHWYAPQSVALTGTWRRYRLATSVPSGKDWAGRPIFLHVSITQGDAEISGPSLALATVGATAEVRRPQRKNMLENPGFDAGAGGWFLECWPPKDVDAPLPSRIADAPESAPYAIRLPGGGASLISAVMPAIPNHPYTLSFSLRLSPGTRAGEAHGDDLAARCFLITPNWKFKELPVKAGELTTEWKRFFVTFRPSDEGHPHANSVYVRIDPVRSIDVDSVQVEDGDAATAYACGPQVGLDAPGDGGILRPGPAELNAIVQLPGGVKDPLWLKLRAVDAATEVVFETKVEIAIGAETRRAISIPVNHELEGVIACQLSVADAAGGVVAESDARYAVFAADPEINSLIGLDTLPLQQTMALFRFGESVSKRLGMGFRRTFYELHSGGGADPALERAARILSEQHRTAKRTMIVIEPANDSTLNFHTMSKAGKPPTDEDVAKELPRYVAGFAEVAHALDGVVDEIEMLNEPNIWTVNGQSAMPPSRYMQVLSAVAPEVRRVAPHVKLALNVNGIDCDYVDAVAKLGGLKLIDLVTVHPYRNSAENAPIVNDLNRLRAIMDRAAPGMPIVNSEQYYGVLNGIHQGEYERSYFAANETEQAGRILQTVLHGMTVGAPFGALTSNTCVFVHTPFSSSWLYLAAGGFRAIAKLGINIVSGRNVPVHDAARALLFTRADGSLVASINARVYGEKGMLTRPKLCSAFDVNGNPLNGDDLPVTYLPLYLTFPAGTAADTAIQSLQTADWRGFAFPLGLTASRLLDGKVKVTVHNHERRALACRIHWTEASAGVTVPRDEWKFELPPFGTADLILPAEKFPWQSDAVLGYEVTCGDDLDAGRLRIPVLLIPRLNGDVETWQPKDWLDLGEESLSKDFDALHPHKGPADLAARVAFAWSPAGLHLWAEVTDDRVVTGPNRGSDGYNFDSLQFYLDQRASVRAPMATGDGNISTWVLGRKDDDSALAWLDQAPGGRFVGANNTVNGQDPEVKAQWKKTATGWQLRATFQPAAIAAVDLRAGTVLGLSLLINDNDGDGRKRGLTLTPPNTEPFGNPWLWKRCQLVDTMPDR